MTYWPIVLLILSVAVAMIVCARRSVAKFNERFPPITDDEFVQRCGPDVKRDVALRVRRIVSEQLGMAYERVSPEQSFVHDLGCD